MKTRINYETARKLKEFCPGLPEPMEYLVYAKSDTVDRICVYDCGDGVFAYQLHDLLSKPFCEAMAIKTGRQSGYVNWKLSRTYLSGGLPAVEAELMKMMEGR